MIFQEPMSALDPLLSGRPPDRRYSTWRAGLSRSDAKLRSRALIEMVGIDAPSRRWHAYPHELSGGQCQRIAIAMAIACDPEILIADEPTTALDVTVAARILELLADLKARLGMAMIFISHDLHLVGRFADRVHVVRRARSSRAGRRSRFSTARRMTIRRNCSPPCRRRARTARARISRCCSKRSISA